jgi:hypothetical protein
MGKGNGAKEMIHRYRQCSKKENTEDQTETVHLKIISLSRDQYKAGTTYPNLV